MIEIICNKDDSDKDAKTSAESSGLIRRPKNIKQIGDVSSDKKIYIEDYAFTYINSIAYNNPEDEQAGVLLGEFQRDNEEKCVFVKGVIKARLGDTVLDRGIYFNENVWNGIYSDVEKYFPNLSVVGWFAVVPEVTTERMLRLKKIHLDNFAGTMKTFYLVDTVEKEENFFLYENGELKKQKGYVCFYERNYEMQEYMLERREKKSTEDTGNDEVMRSIRSVIREKEEWGEQKKNIRFMYGISTFMAVVILVIGINLMNNYEKMKKFDQSINSLLVKMSKDEDVIDVNADGTSSDKVTINKLPGDVYPTEEESKAEETSPTQQMTSAPTDEQTEAATVEETPAAAEPVQEAYIYTVKQGDTIMGICKRYYGSTAKYNEVIKYNNLGDGNMLYVGQEIKLP